LNRTASQDRHETASPCKEIAMKKVRPAERTGRVVAVALVFFAGFAMLALAGGVFERLDGVTRVALAAFAAAFALLTWALDRNVRKVAGEALNKFRGSALRQVRMAVRRTSQRMSTTFARRPTTQTPHLPQLVSHRRGTTAS
jgi:uncharacterized membrane protein